MATAKPSNAKADGAKTPGPDAPYAEVIVRLVYGLRVQKKSRDKLPPEWSSLAEFVESSDRTKPEALHLRIINSYLANVGARNPDVSTRIHVAYTEAWERHKANSIGDEAEATAGVSSKLGELTDEQLGIIQACSIEPERIDWEWLNHIARGKLNLIASEGGKGKTQFAILLAAVISRGGMMPDGTGPVEQGQVLILASEDGLRDTLLPRIVAAEGDEQRISFLTCQVTSPEKDGKPKSIDFKSFQDLDYWRQVISRLPGLRLIIADPLPAYLGRGVNDHKNNEIRAVLEPFVNMLDEMRIGLLGITHLNKSTDQKTPVNKILGSVAYSNIARTVHVISEDPEDGERRFLFMPKNNLVDRKDAPALAFKIEGYSFPDKHGNEIKTSKIVFEAEPLDIQASAALVAGKEAKPRGPSPQKTMEVAAWLYVFLGSEGKPTPFAKIVNAAGEAGHAGSWQPENNKWSNPATLYEARKRVVDLQGEMAGSMVTESKHQLKAGGKHIVHWCLCDAEAPF